MAYDVKLAGQIRAQVQGLPIIEKKMFGGVGYMLHGNMACGILGNDLIVRVPVDEYESYLKKVHVKIFTMQNGPRAMRGWVMVEPAGYRTAKQLNNWIKTGIDFALTLPPK